MSPTHSFHEHTGEVRLRIEASTLPELFEEAARALAELQAEALSEAPAAIVRASVRAPDLQSLLVAWLNELIALSEIEKRVFVRARVHMSGAAGLLAALRGAEPLSIRTAVKAATLHGVKVQREGDRWTAEVVLDV